MPNLLDKICYDTMCSRILCSTIPLLHDEPDMSSAYNLSEATDYKAWKQRGSLSENESLYHLLMPLRSIIRALLASGYCVTQIALRRAMGEHIIIWDTASLDSQYLSLEAWMHYISQDGLRNQDGVSVPARAAWTSTVETVYLLSVLPRTPSTISGAKRKYAIPLDLPSGTVANFSSEVAGWLFIERSKNFHETLRNMCVAICGSILAAWNTAPDPQNAVEAWMKGEFISPLGLLPFIFARLYHPITDWSDIPQDWSKSLTVVSPWNRVLWLGIVNFRSQLLEDLILPYGIMENPEECEPDEENECVIPSFTLSIKFNWSSPTDVMFLRLAGCVDSLDISARDSWFSLVASELNRSAPLPSAERVSSLKAWLQTSFKAWDTVHTEAALSTVQEIFSGRARETLRNSFFRAPAVESVRLSENGLFETLTKAEYELLNGSFFDLRRSANESLYANSAKTTTQNKIDSAEVNFLQAIDSLTAAEFARIKKSDEFWALIFDISLTIAIPKLAAGVLSVAEAVLVQRRLLQAQAYQTFLGQNGWVNVKIDWDKWKSLAKKDADLAMGATKATEFHKTSLASATKFGSQMIKWSGEATPTIAILKEIRAQAQELFLLHRTRLNSMTYREAELVDDLFAPFAGGYPELSYSLLIQMMLVQELQLSNVGKKHTLTSDATSVEILMASHYGEGVRRYHKLAFIRGTAQSPDGRLAYIEEFEENLLFDKSYDFLAWVDPKYAPRAIETIEAAGFQVIMGLDGTNVSNVPVE